jgi:hypothetical protein
LKALKAALDCLSPAVLQLDERIIQLIPPRPPEYYDFGELFSKKTGMGFDALSPAEAIVNYELGFLFNPARANRLNQFKARAGTIGWDDVLDSIIGRTWKQPIQKGITGELQMQTQQMVLSYLIGMISADMQASTNSSSALPAGFTASAGSSATPGYEVKAICFDRLAQLKTFCEKQIKTGSPFKAHYSYAIERIKNPKDFLLPVHSAIAMGAPIGCEEE